MLCQICDCEFRGSIQLKEHKMREHDKKEIDCSQCDFKSVIKKEFRQHIRFAHPEETYKCNQCNYRTVWKSEVSSHKRSEHGKKGNHKCTKCNHISDTLRNQFLHGILYHTLMKKIVKLVSRFEKRHEVFLRKQKVSITTKMLFHCPFCEYRTTYMPALKLHQIQHKQDNYDTTAKAMLLEKATTIEEIVLLYKELELNKLKSEIVCSAFLGKYLKHGK